MATLIILVRHGQTDWNRIERFRGQYDVPLNDEGYRQAEITAQWIHKQWDPSAILTSPLSRAVQTGERIAEACGLPLQLAPGLTDIDYGAWQGMTPEAAHEKWPTLVEKWFQKPGTLQIPGGEALSEVQTRAVAALDAIVEQYKGQVIVLVSHTVVIRAILLGILKADLDRLWQIGQEPCAINLIEYNPEQTRMLSVNCVYHLFG